ncbi:TipAS antibiotic-recognition domain-containing protein, partial [Streptomyces sp. TRM76130]|nr:TipAS antibiotic-recognition domain-containing protein [Streptomyces sp. TRM76130]
MAEAADWSERYTALMAAGEPPSGEAAMALAEEHRQHITTWYYDCPHETHRCLAETYVADERFKAFYDAMRPGLAEHLKDAITANADRRSR